MSAKKMLLVGALLGALAVTFGAFGAHGMPDYLKAREVTGELLLKRLDDWEVASRYLMYHALAVVACGVLAHLRPSRSLNIAVWFLIFGALIFSGMLYTIVLTGITRPFGMIVAIGGLLMIFGWITLAWAGGGYCTAECDLRKPNS